MNERKIRKQYVRNNDEHERKGNIGCWIRERGREGEEGSRIGSWTQKGKKGEEGRYRELEEGGMKGRGSEGGREGRREG